MIFMGFHLEISLDRRFLLNAMPFGWILQLIFQETKVALGIYYESECGKERRIQRGEFKEGPLGKFIGIYREPQRNHHQIYYKIIKNNQL